VSARRIFAQGREQYGQVRERLARKFNAAIAILTTPQIKKPGQNPGFNQYCFIIV